MRGRIQECEEEEGVVGRDGVRQSLKGEAGGSRGTTTRWGPCDVGDVDQAG